MFCTSKSYCYKKTILKENPIFFLALYIPLLQENQNTFIHLVSLLQQENIGKKTQKIFLCLTSLLQQENIEKKTNFFPTPIFIGTRKHKKIPKQNKKNSCTSSSYSCCNKKRHEKPLEKNPTPPTFVIARKHQK